MENIYLISEWYKTDCVSRWKKLSSSSLANIISDVLAYKVDEQERILYGSKKLKKIWS